MVRQGYTALGGRVTIHDSLGLAVARPDEPLHYYSLFSRSREADVLLTLYPGNKYELEAKYTQYVEFHSRPVWPRLDFAPLARVSRRDTRPVPPHALNLSITRSPVHIATSPFRIQNGGLSVSFLLSAVRRVERYAVPSVRSSKTPLLHLQREVFLFAVVHYLPYASCRLSFSVSIVGSSSMEYGDAVNLLPGCLSAHSSRRRPCNSLPHASVQFLAFQA